MKNIYPKSGHSKLEDLDKIELYVLEQKVIEGAKRALKEYGNVFKRLKESDMRTCNHCKQNIELRNPSGFCDHLFYPESCEICKKQSDCEENEKEV